MQNEMLFYTIIDSQNVVLLSRDYALSQMTYRVLLFGDLSRISSAKNFLCVMQPHEMLPE